MKSKKLFKRIAFILLIIFSMALLSCSLNDLDLSLGIEDKPEEEKVIINEDSKVSDKELFFQLKAKQGDKNQLTNINIRKAIFYGINRQRIVEELLADYGSVLNSLFTEDSPYYYPAWDQYNYDPQKAKEHLGKAGYGPDNPLYITIGATEGNVAREKIENMIRSDLEEIGIQIWPSNKPSKDWYGGILKSGGYELGIWALYTADGSYVGNYFSSAKIPPMETEENKDCNNFYWYKNKEVDQILSKLQFENSENAKRELYRELQEKLANDAFSLPLFSRIYTIAHNTKVQNIKIDAVDGNLFYNIDNWELDTEDEVSTIIIGYEEEPKVINPFISNSLFNKYINSVLFKGLWKKGSNGEYVPELAENYEELSYQNSFSNLAVKVKLKEGMFWEDGTPITSQDIYYTWQKILENESGIGNWEQFSKIEDIKIINDTEFDIIFKEKIEGWQELFNVIFPRDRFGEDGQINLFEDYTFSCGPYKIAEWKKGEYLLLERNKYYPGTVPDAEHIKFLFNSDVNKLISALKAGDIDVLSVPVDLKLLDEIEENENLDLLVEKGNLWEHLAICLKPKEE